MTSVLPREIVARIKEETDIVELVRRYVTLAAAGSAFKGLCPFHQEKSPSFSVSPAKGVTVANEVAGLVTAIRFDSGGRVKRGRSPGGRSKMGLPNDYVVGAQRTIGFVS